MTQHRERPIKNGISSRSWSELSTWDFTTSNMSKETRRRHTFRPLDGKVIHSATPTAWGIRSRCGGIRYVHFCITIRRTNYSYRDDRIIIPYTDMNVELGDEPDENDSYNVLTSSIRSLMIWSYRSSFPKRPSTGSRFGRFNVSRVC